jgi:pyruvate dehydrogenase E2 component (dihydrolipoamide acetyltransferase)
MPKLGLTMVEGTVVRWIKNEGETVKQGEPLFEIETEKVQMEIEAQTSGMLDKIMVHEGETAAVGEAIAVILEQPEAIPLTEPPVAAGTSGPSHRKEVVTPVKAAGLMPLSEVRKTTAQRMLTSLQQSAQLTIMVEADVTKLKEFYQGTRAEIEKESKTNLTYTDLIAVAAARALKENPVLNSAYRGDKIEVFEKVHMGIAVATEKGLIVPVLRDAEVKSIEQVARSREEIVNRAREGKLSVEDVEGGTFTVTNLGMYGVSFFTPIINPPESSILGVGAIVDKPSVVDGQVSIRSVMPLSLTFDHRVADGAQAAQFLMRIREILENPPAVLAKARSTSKA